VTQEENIREEAVSGTKKRLKREKRSESRADRWLVKTGAEEKQNSLGADLEKL